jgi:hypothetical protein
MITAHWRMVTSNTGTLHRAAIDLLQFLPKRINQCLCNSRVDQIPKATIKRLLRLQRNQPA